MGVYARAPGWLQAAGNRSLGSCALASVACLPDNTPMAPGRRTKSKVKNRPKYKIVRRLKGRKMKSKKAAAHKRGLGRNKKRRQNRGKKKS
jgi:hypothetical protein